MTDRLIGEAYISLLADAARFRPDADAKVKAALAGMKGVVPLTGDAADIRKKIAAVAAAIKGIDGTIKLDGDTRGIITDIAGLMSAIGALEDRAKNLSLDMDDSRALSKLFGVMAEIEGIQEKLTDFKADVNVNRMIAKFYAVEGVVKDLEAKADNMKANVDIAPMIAKLSVLKADTETLSKMLDSMRAEVKDKAFLAQIITMQSSVLKLAHELQNIPVTADTLPIEASLMKVWATADALHKKLSDQGIIAAPVAPGFRDVKSSSGLGTALLTTAAAQQPMIIKGTGGGFWGPMSNQVRLFGGLLDKVLPKWASAITMWHLAADVIFEIAAAWTPAIIAVGTFAAYAIPVGEKVYSQWKNINTVLDGVGSSSLPDLGKQFDVIQRAIEPGLLTAFGEYILIITHNAGGLGTQLAKVGQVIDVWGAKAVGWAAAAQKGFNNIVGSGAKDFAMIGEGFHQIFRILGTLFHAMPGYVHILLAVGDAFLTLTADVLQFAAPLLKAGLYLHGFMVYVGLAVTGIIALSRAMGTSMLATFMTKTGRETEAAGKAAGEATGKFSKFGNALGATAGFIGAAFYNTGKYTGELWKIGSAAENVGARAKIGAVGSKLLGDALKIIPFGAVGLGAGIAAIAIGTLLYFALRHSTDAADKFASSMKSMIAASSATDIQRNIQVALTQTTGKIQQQIAVVNQQKKVFQATRGAGHAELFVTQAEAVSQATGDLNTYKGTLSGAINAANTYGMRISELTKVFGSAGAAQAALTLAGISAGQVATENNTTWAETLIQLKALAAGYGYMGHQAGAAGNQLAALNIASGKTLQRVQALTQAESQWITLVTSGDSAFTSFEQGQATLAGAMGKGSASGARLTVTVGKLREQFPLAATKMNGLSQSALAARQAFDQQISAGTTLWGNLQTLATASGHTSASQKQLFRAGKDIIAQLLPMAAGSKQATAELSALAQLMGGPATDNFKVLARWVGNTKGAEGDLNRQQAALTRSAANLTTAEKNLGNVLETSVTAAQAAAIAKTINLTGVTQNLANVSVNAHGKITANAVLLSGQYVQALTHAGLSQNTATQYLNAYLGRLGYTPGQIRLVDSALDGNRQKFEAVAASMHLSKRHADDLWNSLQKLKSQSPVNVNINETLTGSGQLKAAITANSITIAASGANASSQSTIGASNTVTKAAGTIRHHAAGWRVPPGSAPSGQDGHLAMLAPGELVIPTSHAARFGDMAKRAGIPGMAGGGVAGNEFSNWQAVANTANQGVQTAANGAIQMTASAMKQFASNLTSGFSKARVPVGAGGKYTGPANFGGGFESMAALLSFARYFMSQGASRAGAAGIAATISGEENSLGPESVGTGGFGLIGWTGNTTGLPPGYHGPTGNVAYDLAVQLAGVIGYARSRSGGWPGPFATIGDPVLAGNIWSGYEAPLVPLSDTRPATAAALYALLGGATASQVRQAAGGNPVQTRFRHHSGGGVISEPVYGYGAYSGIPYSFAENGQPEFVSNASQHAASSGPAMQPQTSFQGKTIIAQNQMIIRLLQQMPFAYARATASSAGKGTNHGYWGAQN